ncbi:hypothetical protein CRUP_035950 [Coryphaenoides rupestris]|nr:hypothetical protein CRUP_035950 [Coryphaenoides rupestris]
MQAFTPAPPHKPPTLLTLVPTVNTPEVTGENHNEQRLEEAWRKVVETNRREREEMAAKCKRRREERMRARSLPQAEPVVEKLLLEPTVTEGFLPWERKQFIFRYFNRNPYVTKGEADELCKRLNLNKSELGAYFGNRRNKCLKSIRRSTVKVLLGFKMTELRKVKHNLLIPKIQPVRGVDSSVHPFLPEETQRLAMSWLLIDHTTPHTSSPGQGSMLATPPCHWLLTCSSHRPKVNA